MLPEALTNFSIPVISTIKDPKELTSNVIEGSDKRLLDKHLLELRNFCEREVKKYSDLPKDILENQY